ncbi:MAG: ATP-dependent protease subunit HslV [bacterium]
MTLNFSNGNENNFKMRGTTVVAVVRDGKVAIAGDGQVTFGDTVMKHTARKVRKMADGGVAAGFAGSVADAFTLFERFEEKLEQYKKNLPRAAMEFAKEWRTDKFLRRLEAMLVVADREHMLVISGGGEVIEPEEKVVGIGSGGAMALAAAKAMLKHTQLGAEEIAREAICIAAGICIYTNDQISIETLD